MAGPRKTSQTQQRGERAPEFGWPTWVDQLAVERLRDPLRAGRVGHAYLLAGPKGVGKSELARAFAQAICCTNLASDDRSRPCGDCRSCRNVARGAHPDVEQFSLQAQAVMADKPSKGANLTIETVRRLRSSATLLPLEGTKRIVIVDDAETLQEPAQQALLKTLEEPPAAVTLLLLADEPEVLLETVRSRCQHVAVRPVAESVVARALVNRGIDDEMAAEIASLSRGCPAWAVSAASDRSVLKSRRDEREAATTWLASSRYERLTTAFRLGEQYSKRRAEVVGVVQAAVQQLREEMLGAAAGQQRGAGGRSLFGERGTPPLALSHAIGASLQCLSDLDANVRPRLALEAMVLKWPSSDPQSR